MKEQVLKLEDFGPESVSWLEETFADQKTHLRCQCGASAFELYQYGTAYTTMARCTTCGAFFQVHSG